MARIPAIGSIDSTWALLQDPYGFIVETCDRQQSDLFQTRIMLQPTICLRGREAAELFYDPVRMMRKGAAPEPLQKTLFGVGGVQGLDDEAHRHRKQMFLSLVTPDRVQALAATSAEWWGHYAHRWQSQPQVQLYEQVQKLLCRCVCAWGGVPLPEEDVDRRTRELTALFDKAGSLTGHLWARLARKKSNQWAGQMIRDVRAGKLRPTEDSAAWIIAHHHDVSGQLLSEHVAAVELLNVLRPTIAVAVFIVFVAHALERYPAAREQVLAGDDAIVESFAQEVRRFYPFFPASVARVREDFEWKGYHFPSGRRVMLDLYGINHDPRLWEQPQEFRADRFLNGKEDLFSFVPQGGGDRQVTHRCPGEDIAVELMKTATRMLTRLMTYQVPPQDLEIDDRRLPALPKSRFIISNVAWQGAAMAVPGRYAV